jgi:hypothetical protein
MEMGKEAHMETTETAPINAEVVSGGHALAVEMDSQRKVAISAPRKEKALYEAALAELEMFPKFAEEAFYSIPYKKADGGEELVEGPSVKASRAMARRWGNCATASRIVAHHDDYIEVEGVFVDFETNFITRRLVSVKKTYIPRSTKVPTPLRDDKLNMAIQAGMSKAERNATLSGLPVYLVEAYFDKAKKLAGQAGKKEGKTIEERFQALYVAFAKLGIEKARVQAYMDEKFPEGADPDDTLGTMRGIFNAIKDGQAKAEDVFPVNKSEGKGAGEGPVGASDLTGKK